MVRNYYITYTTALFTSTHVQWLYMSACEHHTYMLHTCFSCKWYFKTWYLPYMAGVGVAMCSYNMLGIRMYVGQTKLFLEVWIKTQHNLATSRSQMCMGVKVTILKNTFTSNWSTEQVHGHKIEWKCSQCRCPRRLVWMSETWTQIKLIGDTTSEGRSVSSFCWTSMQCSW